MCLIQSVGEPKCVNHESQCQTNEWRTDSSEGLVVQTSSGTSGSFHSFVIWSELSDFSVWPEQKPSPDQAQTKQLNLGPTKRGGLSSAGWTAQNVYEEKHAHSIIVGTAPLSVMWLAATVLPIRPRSDCPMSLMSLYSCSMLMWCSSSVSLYPLGEKTNTARDGFRKNEICPNAAGKTTSLQKVQYTGRDD